MKVVLDELDDIKANVTNVAQRMHGKLSALSDPDIDVKLNELRIDNDVVILLILELRVFFMQFLILSFILIETCQDCQIVFE